jgi:hypothetical protein
MNAAEIAAALGDERRDGGGWKCRCPCCGGRLSLRDGYNGRAICHCWGGCAWREMERELRRIGHLSGDRPAPPPPEEIARRKAAEERRKRAAISRAAEIWAEGVPIEDTLGDIYMRSVRGIDIGSPFIDESAAKALRYLARARHSAGVYRPAIVAAIEHIEHGFTGAHVTFLATDGASKTTLDPPRKTFGSPKGGAVRLGKPRPNSWFVVGEGIETVLSVMQVCALPGWAALSANGIVRLELPDTARLVVICADNDCNGVGPDAARRAVARFIGEGRRGRIFMPPTPGSDWNDVLLGRAPAQIAVAEHAA